MEPWKIAVIVGILAIVLVETHMAALNFGLREGLDSCGELGSIASCWDGCVYYDRLVMNSSMVTSAAENDSPRLVIRGDGFETLWAKTCQDICWVDAMGREIPGD